MKKIRIIRFCIVLFAVGLIIAVAISRFADLVLVPWWVG